MSAGYRLADIADFLAVELIGCGEARITALSSIDTAVEGHVSFLSRPKFAEKLTNFKGSAIILSSDVVGIFDGPRLVSPDPYLSYARLSEWFSTAPRTGEGVHASAVVDPTATIGGQCTISANAVIGPDVAVSDGCYVGANSSVGARSSLGRDCRVECNVSIYHDVHIGNNVTIHSGSVIGADGFGFAPDGSGGWQKIFQNGGVKIGDGVEIGACTTIDRGALDDTVIGSGVILDNHVHLAHNVRIGDDVAMAAFVGIAGSTVIGNNCILAGNSGVVGHLTVTDNVHLTVRTTVTKSLSEPGSYSSAGLPLLPSSRWRRNAVGFGRLAEMERRMRALESTD